MRPTDQTCILRQRQVLNPRGHNGNSASHYWLASLRLCTVCSKGFFGCVFLSVYSRLYPSRRELSESCSVIPGYPFLLESESSGNLSGDGTVPHLDCCGSMNLQVTEWHRTVHTHCVPVISGFDAARGYVRCNHWEKPVEKVSGTSLYHFCNFLSIYNYFKIKNVEAIPNM